MYFDNPNFRDHIYLNNEEFAGFMHNDFKESFSETQFANSLLRNRMLNELFHEVVRVILNEDDLNSMMYSIENRSPYWTPTSWSLLIPSRQNTLFQRGMRSTS